MSFENPQNTHERAVISVESLKEKLHEYPKLFRALVCVSALNVAGVSANEAQAQNEITGNITQSQERYPGRHAVTGTSSVTRNESGTIVTPRSHWVIPPDSGISAHTKQETGTVSIGEVYVDGKKITDK